MAVIPVTVITNRSKQVVQIPYNPTTQELSVTSLPATSSGIMHLQPGVQFRVETSRLFDLTPLLSEGLITVTGQRVIVVNPIFSQASGSSSGLAVPTGVADVPSVPQSPTSTSLAIDDNYQTNLNTPLTGENVQLNDTNDGTGGLESFITQFPTNGQAVLFRNGDFEYTPDLGFDGQDTVQYQYLHDYN